MHIISLKTGIEALLDSSCVIYSSTVMCATFPSSSTLFFCFFSFHPHGLLLPPILLQGRQEAGLAASAPWRAGAVTVLEISSLWVLDTFWALRLYTVLTCLPFHILSSVWLKMFNRLVRSPIENVCRNYILEWYLNAFFFPFWKSRHNWEAVHL